jgi:electron transfer flavoprotein alpha subunit
VGGNPRKAELCSVVLGASVHEPDVRELIFRGADRVYLAESPALAHFLAEPYAHVLARLIRRHAPQVVLAGATSTGRTLMPYLAVRLHTGLTADCTGLDIDPQTGNLIQTRPAVGGNVLATILTTRHRPQMATVRPKSARPPERVEGRLGRIVKVRVPTDLPHNGAKWLGLRRMEEGEGNIQDAEKIVAGGRGMKKGPNFALIRQLAAKLGASVAASREAVDRGWISYPHQVGLTGKTVTPRLYMAVGISGSIQHLAGMKTAECIVAINNDPLAQIFQVADFGVVGDLFEFLPFLMEEIEQRKAREGSDR